MKEKGTKTGENDLKESFEAIVNARKEYIKEQRRRPSCQGGGRGEERLARGKRGGEGCDRAAEG